MLNQRFTTCDSNGMRTKRGDPLKVTPKQLLLQENQLRACFIKENSCNSDRMPAAEKYVRPALPVDVSKRVSNKGLLAERNFMAAKALLLGDDW